MVSYEPLIEVSARRDLYALPREERDKLRRVLKDVAEREQPTHHEKTKNLQGFEQVFRVRCGNTRAVCKLEKPNLLILRVNTRDKVYDGIDDLDVADTPDPAEV